MNIIAALFLGMVIGSAITYFALQKMQYLKIIREYESQIQNLRESHQNDLREVRERSLNGSRSAIKGKVAEQFSPILPEFQYLPSDARFIGDPIDYIIFDGYTNFKDNNGDENDIEIIILEIKTGSATLSKGQQAIAKAINSGRVRCEVMRPAIEPKRYSPVRERYPAQNPETKAYSVKSVREKYPQAYKLWSKSEDEDLIESYNQGMSIDDLAQRFQRKPGGIRSRLRKLGLLL